ncbi:MAG: glycosyltransferase family 39 protein [Cytophagales bacterium]|nr:glycosyltransferase family 39 protein [Bernardetiaceae bacterium]MDW8210140.1 glycosyltransferase family 39 protein [Cytophagales bacterium]
MQKESILFFWHLLTRLVFAFATGFLNNYALQPDSKWLVQFGMQAAQGNFNFELERFIASPLFPAVVGLFKWIFKEAWQVSLVIFQLIVSAISGVYIYKIAYLWSDREKVAWIASLLFSVFPMTLWFTHTFSQECLFQVLFIICMYYLSRSLAYGRWKDVFLSAIFFSLAYQTKSHILLFSPFVPLLYWHHFKFTYRTFLFTTAFASIALFFSLPYGLYHYRLHGVYVLSSNGGPYQFYLGNTWAGYKTVVEVPDKNSEDYLRIKDITVHAGYFNGSQRYYDSLLSLSQKEKQSLFLQEAIYWIMRHPTEFIKLKCYNLFLFLFPGVSWRHYSFGAWLLSFLISLPIYALAYWTMLKEISNGNKKIMPAFYVFVTMLIFSVVWYVQNRFRTITIEPIYVILAAFPISHWLENYRQKWTGFLKFPFRALLVQM